MSISKKKFINHVEKVVDEMIDGYVQSTPGLSRLQNHPVVVDSNYENIKLKQVTLLSGGGSGHEPAHIGYVGKGMLTAAVCGQVFASPSSGDILDTLRTITGPHGCLMIVKNYTGDCLNFGLACEKAKAEGFKVEMVIVKDDCSLSTTTSKVGRRGLAGTVFVHKIAGAAASAGLSLQQVRQETEEAALSVVTMGVAFNSCTIPGNPSHERLKENEMELGLGIHGEPGIEQCQILKVDEIVDIMVKKILNGFCDDQPPLPGDSIAALVNNLGGTTSMELAIATRRVEETFRLQGFNLCRIYQGSLMTSLDMPGISLSILKVNDPVRLQRLDYTVDAPAWPNVSSVLENSMQCKKVVLVESSLTTTVSKPSTEIEILSREGNLMKTVIQACTSALIENEEKLTEWDAIVGDGDCGMTLKRGAQVIQEDLEQYPLNNPVETLRALAKSIENAVGGSSGVLYTIFFNAAATALSDAWKVNSSFWSCTGASSTEASSTEASSTEASCTGSSCTGASCAGASFWLKGLEAGTASIQRYGGADLGDRTMVDALIPCCHALKQALESGKQGLQAFEMAVLATEESAKNTSSLLAKAGRSSYVPENLQKTTPDPGAMAFAIGIRAIYNALEI